MPSPWPLFWPPDCLSHFLRVPTRSYPPVAFLKKCERPSVASWQKIALQCFHPRDSHHPRTCRHLMGLAPLWTQVQFVSTLMKTLQISHVDQVECWGDGPAPWKLDMLWTLRGSTQWLKPLSAELWVNWTLRWSIRLKPSGISKLLFQQMLVLFTKLLDLEFIWGDEGWIWTCGTKFCFCLRSIRSSLRA